MCFTELKSTAMPSQTSNFTGEYAHVHAYHRTGGARAAKMTHQLYLFAISIDLGSVKHDRATNDDVEVLCVLYRPQIDGSGE